MIAALMRQSGTDFVRSLEIKPPLNVLDLGCGDGTTALPLAALGADVLGVDIARNLVAAGQRRAEAAGLPRLQFRHGDACALTDIATHSFDLTLSVFGAMFAPKPFEVAQEMVRVTRPGGRIVMGNWIPNDPTSFVSHLLSISSAYLPPPPAGYVSPMSWGVDSLVYERFERAGVARERVKLARDVFYFRSADLGPNELIRQFRRYYGPTINAFEAAEKKDQAYELLCRLLELARAQNRAPAGQTLIPATFLRVTVQL